MTRNQDFRDSPLYHLEIGTQSSGPKPFRLSNAQIALGFLSIVALIGFAIIYGQRNAPFYIMDIRWESQNRECRVYFTVANRKGYGINASAAIMAFAATRVRGIDFTYTIYELKGTIKVPIRLEGHETRLLSHDVALSSGPSECSHVEIIRLSAFNPTSAGKYEYGAFA